MKVLPKKRSHLSRFWMATLFFFLPFLLFHFSWITPVIHRSCLCPEGPHHCSCNCRKCVNSRGGFQMYCHTKAGHGPDGAHEGEKHIDWENSQQSETGRVSLETLYCDCHNHFESITHYSKAFLINKSFGLGGPLHIVTLRLINDAHPPQVVHYQPEVPG